MGSILQAGKLPPNTEKKCLCIYCNSEKAIDRAISVNTAIAQELMEIRKKNRTIKLEQCFSNVIDSLPDGVIIKDIDVLFNPAYKIDIMKMLVNVYKHKRFGIVWNGSVSEEKLIYSEEGLLDYKTYDINDYDIVCVV